jgi:1-acyl-sn-glycerol-3-phosphate acyltransferase
MYELMELSGQEYVDIYASTMKERLAAARRASRPSRAGARPAPEIDGEPTPELEAAGDQPPTSGL